MQDSLGGTANTALIICCSPSLDNAAETLSSLRFGVRARGIVNSVQANAVKLLRPSSQLDTAKQLEVSNCQSISSGSMLHAVPALVLCRVLYRFYFHALCWFEAASQEVHCDLWYRWLQLCATASWLRYMR